MSSHLIEVLVAVILVFVFYPREQDRGVSLISGGKPTDYDWENTEEVIFQTETQNFTLLMYNNAAPQTCGVFRSLVRSGLFNNKNCYFDVYVVAYIYIYSVWTNN
jgi:hypothetical protein